MRYVRSVATPKKRLLISNSIDGWIGEKYYRGLFLPFVPFVIQKPCFLVNQLQFGRAYFCSVAIILKMFHSNQLDRPSFRVKPTPRAPPVGYLFDGLIN